MKTAIALTFIFLTALCNRASAAASDTPAPSKPNIIFVLADDLGIDGVSCYGADKHHTPKIDALAASGTRFQTCYAAPLCGPSRCLLMSGRYAFRTGGLTNQSWRGGGPGAKSADEYPMPSSSSRPAMPPDKPANGGRWANCRATGDSTNSSPTTPPAAGTGKRSSTRMARS